MSTIDTHINWGSSYLVNDLYRLFIKKKASEKHYVFVGRLSTLLTVILSVFVGYFLVNQMMAWFLFINSVMVAFILPLSWLRFFWWRHNIYGEAAAIIIGLPLSYIIWFPLGFSQTQKHPFWHGFFILFALGWITIILADMLTRPEKKEKLKEFYLKCRPPGFWGPVKAEIEGMERKAIREENLRDIFDCFLGALFCLSAVGALSTFFSREWLLFLILILLSLGGGGLFLWRWKKRGVFASL